MPEIKEENYDQRCKEIRRGGIVGGYDADGCCYTAGDKLQFIGDSSAIIAGAETYGLYYRILNGVGGFKAKSTTKTSITLGWNKGTTASGYQLQQYKGGKWVTVYTGTKATNTSYTVKNLKAGTAGYKFRIRAYRTYGSSKQYGSWSKELTVRTKK